MNLTTLLTKDPSFLIGLLNSDDSTFANTLKMLSSEEFIFTNTTFFFNTVYESISNSEIPEEKILSFLSFLNEIDKEKIQIFKKKLPKENSSFNNMPSFFTSIISFFYKKYSSEYILFIEKSNLTKSAFEPFLNDTFLSEITKRYTTRFNSIKFRTRKDMELSIENLSLFSYEQALFFIRNLYLDNELPKKLSRKNSNLIKIFFKDTSSFLNFDSDLFNPKRSLHKSYPFFPFKSENVEEFISDLQKHFYSYTNNQTLNNLLCFSLLEKTDKNILRDSAIKSIKEHSFYTTENLFFHFGENSKLQSKTTLDVINFDFDTFHFEGNEFNSLFLKNVISNIFFSLGTTDFYFSFDNSKLRKISDSEFLSSYYSFLEFFGYYEILELCINNYLDDLTFTTDSKINYDDLSDSFILLLIEEKFKRKKINFVQFKKLFFDSIKSLSYPLSERKFLLNNSNHFLNDYENEIIEMLNNEFSKDENFSLYELLSFFSTHNFNKLDALLFLYKFFPEELDVLYSIVIGNLNNLKSTLENGDNFTLTKFWNFFSKCENKEAY